MFLGYICIKVKSMFVNWWKMDFIRIKIKYLCLCCRYIWFLVGGYCGVW